MINHKLFVVEFITYRTYVYVPYPNDFALKCAQLILQAESIPVIVR
jgi:hypothetical protein